MAFYADCIIIVMQSKLIKSVMSLWPSNKQWKSWSLPNKLAAIGVFVGIVAISLSIFFFVFNYFSRPNLTDIVRTVAKEYKHELSKQYPTAHTVFGVYQDGFVVPKGLMPENLEIEWGTGRVQSTNNNVLIVTLPNMTLNGKSFVFGTATSLAKQIGAKSGSIIKLGWFNPIVEVIGIHDELVVVALGFPAGESQK